MSVKVKREGREEFELEVGDEDEGTDFSRVKWVVEVGVVEESSVN